MFKGTPEFDREKGTADRRRARGDRRALQRHDLVRPHQLLRDDPVRRGSRRRSRSRPRGCGGALLRDEDRRAGDDRRPQRVRARRELALPGALQADLRDGVSRAPVPPSDDRVAQRHRRRFDRPAAGVLRHLLPPEQRDRDAHRRLRGGRRARRDRAAVRRRSRRRRSRSRAVYTVEPPQEGERRFVVRRAGEVAWCGLLVEDRRGAARRHAGARGARQRPREAASRRASTRPSSRRASPSR